jgi:hypothetical protein
MTERRRHERYVFTAPATLECGSAKVSGAILDISSTGARMRLASRLFLDQTCIVTAADYGVRVPGRVVWRRGSDVGIFFLPEPPEAPPRLSFGRRHLPH